MRTITLNERRADVEHYLNEVEPTVDQLYPGFPNPYDRTLDGHPVMNHYCKNEKVGVQWYHLQPYTEETTNRYYYYWAWNDEQEKCVVTIVYQEKVYSWAKR